MNISRETKYQRQIEWRREKVLELASDGYGVREIARILEISHPTVSRDIQRLRHQAREQIRKYIDDQVPFEYHKTLIGLQNIIKSMSDIISKSTDNKEIMQASGIKMQALNMKMELVSNVNLVHEAIDLVEFKKDGNEYPLFDYELQLFDALANHKYVWVKKASGLGVTEFMLRYMAWLAARDNTYRNTQFPMVCCPNQDIAIKLIKRIKLMFESLAIYFATKETIVELNEVTIEAFPSNHLDAYRSLVSPKFIFIDEGDFFRESDQADVRNVSERYIAKSNPWIVMVSTPNAPGQQGLRNARLTVKT